MLVKISEKQAWSMLDNPLVENAPYLVLNLAGKMVVTEFVLENTNYGEKVAMGRWFEDAELQASECSHLADVKLTLEREETISGQDETVNLCADHFDWYVQRPFEDMAHTAKNA